MVSASLYHHFLTKEEMLHAIVRKSLLELVERALDIASQPTDRPTNWTHYGQRAYSWQRLSCGRERHRRANCNMDTGKATV